MADEENKPLYSEWEAKYYKTLEKKQQLQAKYYNEVKNDEKIIEYLSKYRKDSQTTFLKDFAEFKAEYELESDKYFKLKQAKDLQFHKAAEEMLWYIQQKKLFDLQCLWRAEQIKIKQIKICDDFRYWSADIKRCPFLDPITDDEVELLIQYVSSFGFEKILFKFFHWQDYDTFTEEHKGDQEILSMPEWYHFYNMHRGTESLMLLSDIRGEKEGIYQQAAIRYRMSVSPQMPSPSSEQEQEEDDALQENENEEYDLDDPAPYQFEKIIAPDDNRPFLGRNRDNEITDFINRFEDEKIKSINAMRQRLDQKEQQVDRFDAYTFRIALDTLLDAGDEYPIDAYFSWRQAVVNLANKFQGQNIAKAIPLVYEQYKFRIESGIAPFLTRIEKKEIREKKKDNKFDRELILQGRKVMNEPEDFNF